MVLFYLIIALHKKTGDKSYFLQSHSCIASCITGKSSYCNMIFLNILDVQLRFILSTFICVNCNNLIPAICIRVTSLMKMYLCTMLPKAIWKNVPQCTYMQLWEGNNQRKKMWPLGLLEEKKRQNCTYSSIPHITKSQFLTKCNCVRYNLKNTLYSLKCFRISLFSYRDNLSIVSKAHSLVLSQRKFIPRQRSS